MIDMMFRSAKLFHPGCRCVILSNKVTNLSLLASKYEISIHDSKPISLMLDRTRAMADFVEHFDFSGPLAFVDSDILFNHSLEDVWRRDFDVALTYRDHPMPPVNGGLILLNCQRPEACKHFFTRFLAIYREKYIDRSTWFGDQEALSDLIGNSPAEYLDDVVDADGCRVLLLPCDQYNFSPSPEVSEISESLRERVAIHFKGPRKFLMPLFWNAYLGPKEQMTLMTIWRSLQARFKIWRSRMAK